MIGGMLIGAAIGAALIAGTCATGGLLGAAIIAGCVAGGGLAGGKIAHGLSAIFNIPGITTGLIVMQTSPNVKIGGIFAARAKLDGGPCNGLFFMNHFPMPAALIAQGSKTVAINGQPAARVGDKLVCSAVIQKGENTVQIGGPTATVLAIFDNEAFLRDALMIVGLVAGAVVLGAAVLAVAAGTLTIGAFVGGLAMGAGAMFASWGAQKLGDMIGPGWGDLLSGVTDLGGMAVMAKISGGIGEPVYPGTGEVCTRVTDFVLPGTLEIRFERCYASSLNQQDFVGRNWCCSWGQRVINTGAGIVHYFPGDGRRLLFELNSQPDVKGWLHNPVAENVLLRPTLTGFEVFNEAHHTLRFDSAFGNAWAITSLEDRNQNAIRFHYDSTGALRTLDHTGGYRLRVSGDAGHITAIALELSGGGLSTLVRYQYDSAGCLTGVDNGSGEFLRYEYDAAARMTRWTDRKQTWYEYRYDQYGRCTNAEGPGGTYRYTFLYDTDARTATAIDSYGSLYHFRYDEQHREIARHDPNGGVTVTEYDERGNKTSVTDPELRRTEYAYDSGGNLVESTNAEGQTTRIEYDSNGLPVTLTDAAGQRWLRRYDERGNLIEAGPENGRHWRYEYDRFGNLIRTTDPANESRRFAYDSTGLLLAVTDWEGYVTRFKRDDFGRVLSQIDPLGRETKFTYNTLQKLGRIVLPNESKIEWGYDKEGNLTDRVAPDGSSYIYEYGLFDKLQSIKKPSGATLKFTYDLETRLSSVTNERGESWDYEYDKAGRVIREKEFSGRVLLFKYDASGFLIERVNGNGESVGLKRNKLGQIVAKKLSDGTTAEFEYDSNGFVTRAKNESITVKFERDSYGRVLREIQGGSVVESQYDARGLRTRRRNSSGDDTNWRYDANGRLEGMVFPGDEWLEFTRDAAGRDVERRLNSHRPGVRPAWNKADGFTLHQEYDILDRLSQQSASGNRTGMLSERRYHYDLNSNPTGIDDSLWGAVRLNYDIDGRIQDLTRSQGRSESFQYDEAGDIAAVWSGGFSWNGGNRPAMGSVKLRFLSQGGRLESVGETQYLYDADGRTIEKREGDKVWRYEWSIEGQLRSVVTPNGEHWKYEYDALGRRVRKSGPRGTTTYVWDGSVVAEEVHAGRSVAWFFEPGTFRPIAKQENGNTYACVTDQVGTPRELVSSSGTLAWSAQFTAFGEAETVRANETDCAIRFQGQWFDEESWLHYNWNRYYEPGTGRYLNPDPIGLDGGTRSYGYVHNPLGWIDPMGLGGTFGTGKPPHVANVTVTDPAGNTKFQDTFQSGNMTPEEAALGFPQSSLATHTEARATRQVPLEPGDSMLIEGQYPPCPSCKGKMNARAAETGADIKYTYPEDGELKAWSANSGGCK